MLGLSGLSRGASRTLGRSAVRSNVPSRATSCARVPNLQSCHENSIKHFASATVLRQDFIEALKQHDSSVSIASTPSSTNDFTKSLPAVCPGCGALSQTVEPETAGYYSRKSRANKRQRDEDENNIFQQAMARLPVSDVSVPQAYAPFAPESVPESVLTQDKPLICDRCHNLLHYSKGTSILHPSIQSIQDIIKSSPHRHNHIYHVLDAADFPMSLIPNVVNALELPRLRTQNRRSKTKQYIDGREADVSFIITRADLLAPKKEQVDRLMPYLQETLRDALGRGAKNIRLGNVSCVSAKRGWWTPSVKQEIWKRGGAGWMVGKVNVGKSALFEAVFPKGRNSKDVVDITALRRVEAEQQLVPDENVLTSTVSDAGFVPLLHDTSQDPVLDDMNSTLTIVKEPSIPLSSQAYDSEVDDEMDMAGEAFDDLSLLPPVQPETRYPQMPLVSALPGTTASPIRVPFGNGKGELIDLPGVLRSSMETHVRPEHHSSLVMTSRVVPEQYSLKPGQSLLLGGIIRITPKSDDLVFLAYPFIPLKPHPTGTQKAIAIQTGMQEDGTPYTGTIESIATDKAKGRIKSAGTFKLGWDITRRRAGPLTDRAAGKQKVADLPFTIYGADILIEGIGWIEMVCQVRNKRRCPSATDQIDDSHGSAEEVAARPEVEVFTPKGKFASIRRPMNAWLLGGPKMAPKHARRPRPRMSMSMQKRKEGGRTGSPNLNGTPD